MGSKQCLPFATPYILKSKLLFLTKTLHPTIIQRYLVFQNIANKLHLQLHAKHDMLKRKHCIVSTEPG